MTSFDLTINEISKIEGKASLTVTVKDDRVEDLRFAITEYKRFYTQALRGKDIVGLPQLSCRICGTCSNAHLLCGILAAEQILGIQPSAQTVKLRQLLNYGLLIRDHGLHCYVFALPDLLGIDNILDLDEQQPDERQILEDTFAVKAVGNRLSLFAGGRSVHAPYPTVGGFTKLPSQEEIPALVSQLNSIRPAVLRLIQLFAASTFTLEQDVEFMALLDQEYSFLGGSVLRSTGDQLTPQQLAEHFEHVSIPYSHASGYTMKGRLYFTGALARLNLGKQYLHPHTRRDAAAALALFPSRNIYHNNIAQGIEILHAIDASLDILQQLTLTPERPGSLQRKAGEGIGIIEAPRGLLFYKLNISANGRIEDISIIVPTGQNQIVIERSLFAYFQNNLHLSREVLANEAEKIVRAYDPCMSCASHFLKINWIAA